eukprot:8422468-Alexandrium_andersonii.AAC.1
MWSAFICLSVRVVSTSARALLSMCLHVCVSARLRFCASAHRRAAPSSGLQQSHTSTSARKA